jgi:aspartate/methionine/tyrosine aminotransferase
MSGEFAERAGRVQPFLAVEILERALELEARGREILHLEFGEPDFPPPPAVVEACQRALKDGETRYTESRGIAPLREAIARDHERRSGVAVDPGRVIVTNGTSPAMLLVFSLLVDPGDEVVIPTPHYACYPNFVHVAGGRPVFVPTRPEDGYRIDVDAVRAAIGPRTVALIMASPANPTGAVQDEATMRALAGLGVPLISDEVYHGLVYGDAVATSALGMDERVYVLDGFSKRYAMTGFRLGYVIAPDAAVRPLQSMAQNLFLSTTHFVQRAGIAALEHGRDTLRDMRIAYARRRGLMLEVVRGLGLSVASEPRGAFYVFADARAIGGDSRALAFDLLERAGVALTPGVDFGAAGEGFLRFSYAAADETIRRAAERLREALPG